MKLIKKLKESYPIEVQLKSDLKNILVVTLLPPAILFLFQPFEVFINFDFQDLNSWLAVSGFGILSGSLTFVFWVLLPSTFKSYFENFNILQAILFLFLFIIALSSSIFLYIKFLEGSVMLLWEDYFIVLSRFIVVGLFTSIILVLFNQTQRLRSNLQLSDEMNSRLKKEKKTKEKIIKTEKDKEVIKLSEETFLFAQSTDNYCTVHFLHNGQPQKKLYRLSLKSLEMQSSEVDKFVRCHRSYLINTQMVLLTEGNSRGLELTLKYVDHTIPVSRRYIQEISRKI